MTVLRRVVSLGRSHSQIWRKCGVASKLRYPFTKNMQSLSSFFPCSSAVRVHAVQSFSTFSSTTSDQTTPVVEAEAPIEALQVASSQAQQISSKPIENPPDAIEAADAILTVTRDKSVLKMAVSDPTVDATHVKKLHQALIDVTSRCFSLFPSQNVVLLAHALRLARRAHDLELPLHLPLYQSLCTALAQQQTTTTKDRPRLTYRSLTTNDQKVAISQEEIVDSILEVASMAASSLHTSLQGSFFSDALVALIEHARFSSALVLVKAMKNRFHVSLLDVSTYERVIKAVNVENGQTEQEADSAFELLELFKEDCRTGMENSKHEALQELKEIDEMFQEVQRRANVVRERRAAFDAHDSDDNNNEQKMRDSALLDKAIKDYFKAADAVYQKTKMFIPSGYLNRHRVSDPTAPRNATQNKTGATDAPCIAEKVAFADIKLSINDQFRFHLAKEMEARDIEVPRKKDGDPDIVKSKKAFKEYLLKTNEEDAKLDDGKSFKPRYPDLWSDLLASPEMSDEADSFSGYDASDPAFDPKSRAVICDAIEELSKSAEEVHGSMKVIPEQQTGDELQKVRVRIKVNTTTGEVEDVDVSSSSVPKDEDQGEDQELDLFDKGMVYMRDPTSKELPDVTSQLVKLNGDQNVLYTRQFEKKILKEKTRSPEDFF